MLELFKSFFFIGAFTFGGGVAMIPIIEREVVDVKKWLTTEEFLDAIAIAQASPGVLAANMSIFIGYKLKGFKGAIASVLGAILPSVAIILLIATTLYQFRHLAIVENIFMGIRPAVVALIASSVIGLARKSKFQWIHYAVMILIAVLIYYLNISPIAMILVGGFGYVFLRKNQWIKPKTRENKNDRKI